jgi:hypothetical protein
MEIWIFYPCLYFKKQVKYSFLHQFCSDLHEAGTVRFYAMKPNKSYEPMNWQCTAMYGWIFFYLSSILSRKNVWVGDLVWSRVRISPVHRCISSVHGLITWWLWFGLTWFQYQHIKYLSTFALFFREKMFRWVTWCNHVFVHRPYIAVHRPYIAVHRSYIACTLLYIISTWAHNLMTLVWIDMILVP